MGRTKLNKGARAAKFKAIAGEGNRAKAVATGDVQSEAVPIAPTSEVVAAVESLPAPGPAPQVAPPAALWRAADATVVGGAHLRANPPKPCQDAALADTLKRPLVVVADGAGSAAVSHLGAAAVVAGVRRLCRTLEGDLVKILDAEPASPGMAETLSRKIVAHASGILDDLAEAHTRGSEDFRCTLLVWLAGRQRAFWLKVGDGALVADLDGEAHCVGPSGKGEFANQTNFIGPRLDDSRWAWGELDATGLSGLAAMSDGAAERLVSGDGCRVSPAMSKLLRGVAEAQVGRREIFGLLAEADFWKGTSGDDKSLALIARVAIPLRPELGPNK